MQFILVEYIGENIKQDHMYTVSEKYKNKNSKLMNILSLFIWSLKNKVKTKSNYLFLVERKNDIFLMFTSSRKLKNIFRTKQKVTS